MAGSNISAHAQPLGIYHTARAIKIFKDKHGRYPNTRQEYDRFVPEYLKMLSNGENKAEELERAVHRATMLHDVQGHLQNAKNPRAIERLNNQIGGGDKISEAQNDSLTKFKKQLLGLEPPDDLNTHLPNFELDWDMKKWNKKD